MSMRNEVQSVRRLGVTLLVLSLVALLSVIFVSAIANGTSVTRVVAQERQLMRSLVPVDVIRTVDSMYGVVCYFQPQQGSLSCVKLVR